MAQGHSGPGKLTKLRAAVPRQIIPDDRTTPDPVENTSAQPPGTPAAPPSTPAADSGAPQRQRRRLRLANPFPSLRRATRRTIGWARSPAGRLALAAIMVTAVVVGTVTAGGYFVPRALDLPPLPSPSDSAAQSEPGPTAPISLPAGPATPASGLAQPPGNGQRPADVLASWAQQTGTKVGIPVVAVQAYGYAELVLARTTPACHLTWTTLAAIGKVESNHGIYRGSVLEVDGSVRPPIFGLPLDGKGGRKLIADTDHGALDGDTTYDRAVGPMQFIPSTWQLHKVDADNSGTADPNNINDASLTAGKYLCANGRDLSRPDSWWQAILSYNAVQPYVQQVLAAANDYGVRSRS